MLDIIDACYRELANRASLAGTPSGNEVSQRTLARIFSKPQQKGVR